MAYGEGAYGEGVYGGGTRTYSSEVLADSPWGYWRCQEASGATLGDSTPNARPMTIVGSPTLNQAGPFPGSTAISWTNVANQRAQTSATVATSAATLEAWVYLTAYPTALTAIVACAAGYGGATFDKDLGIDPSGKLRLHIYNGSVQSLVSTTALTLGAWHHVVASVGAAGTKIRVDKTTVLSVTGVTSSYTGAQNVLIRGGGYDYAGDNYANTSPVIIGEAALYTTQLSDARTDAHYDAASTPPAATGTIAASLPALSVSLSGGIEFSGTITATLPPLGANLSGTSVPAGVAGTLSAVLPALSGDFGGTSTEPSYSGTLDALLPPLSANLAGQSFAPGQEGYIGALLPALTASLSGDVLGRAGLGLALDSSAVLTVEAALEPEPSVPPGTPSTALHIIAPTVPVPTLVAGRPQ